MSFSIPDAALTNVMLRKARDRNLKRLSPFSYAYHPDLNLFDAVLALRGFITEKQLYSVQIDFQKYFDTIPTRYLINLIDDKNKLSLTPHEKYVFKEFLHHQFGDSAAYASGKFLRRHIGTPQGCSLSLLLANLANDDLDRALERRSGRFVRFADDVVALCDTYEEAQGLQQAFVSHCANSGLVINKKKSPGIAIISNEDAEIRTFEHFDYLGYRFTKNGLTVPTHVESRIKSKISRLCHVYLIHYPQKFDFARSRSNSVAKDWDLMGLIGEIRGYLYGGLHENEIRNFLYNGEKLQQMKGLMGFYALIDDKSALQRLDGWLVNNLRRVMIKRNQMLKKMYPTSYGCPTPSNEQLILGDWFDPKHWRGDGDIPNTQIPSFVRGWRAARKYYFTFGLEDVEPPHYGYY
ncbi:Reverse transcriptase (RNA-dependent DNA polymerase) [Pseudovibrio sp. Ad26]|nr:Reverse transcriptase (RNA-dependent DNA polymerase) [Pseudovibrio sp. Ad26]